MALCTGGAHANLWTDLEKKAIFKKLEKRVRIKRLCNESDMMQNHLCVPTNSVVDMVTWRVLGYFGAVAFAR